MDNSDNLYFSKLSQNADYDSFFEEDGFQDFEFDRELNQFLGKTDLDETEDYFWREMIDAKN